jgi:hypothetical protein
MSSMTIVNERAKIERRNRLSRLRFARGAVLDPDQRCCATDPAPEIVVYLHMLTIRDELLGPNANLTSSLKRFQEAGIYFDVHEY